MIYLLADEDFNIFILIDYILSLKINILFARINDNTDYINIINNSPNDTFIFINQFFKIPITDQPNVYILNVEQLSIQSNIDNIMNTPANIKLIDYSFSNIEYLKQLNRSCKYLPYQVNESEIFNYPKIQDVVSIGWESDRRLYIRTQLLQKNIQVNHIDCVFGNERDQILFKYKILVNVHFKEEYKVFEEMRCNRCIFNKMIVISEKSVHNENNRLKKYMIECEYSEIPDMVEKVLNGYDYYYYKLFTDFDNDLEEIKQYYAGFNNFL
jgi:hypothetical protein